jgi:hypothetical protein
VCAGGSVASCRPQGKLKWRGSVVVALSTVAILLVFSSLVTARVSANAAVMVTEVQSAAFTNGVNITMPTADVEVNITRDGDIAYITLTGNYTITSSLSQNATLAYVYPGYTSVYETSEMELRLNGTLVTYETYAWSDPEIQERLPQEFVEQHVAISFARFAVFDLEMLANVTYEFCVNSFSSVGITGSGTIVPWRYLFTYDYIVGSAQTFNGSTIEAVTFRVYDEPDFLSVEFTPSDSLTLTEEECGSRAVWSFNTSEFEYDYVTFSGMFDDPESGTSSTSNLWLYLTAAAVAGTTTVILVYAARHRFR